MESMTIDLFQPGMSPLHRAGLGGLACTIKAWKSAKPEKVAEARRLIGDCKFDNRSVTLCWEKPADAREFFRRLYLYAFHIDEEGLIDMPGARVDATPLNPTVKAELQAGLSRTILQFGPNRKSSGFAIKTYEADERITIQHQVLTDFTHRNAWEDLFTGRGALREAVSIMGTIAPGYMRRHEAHKNTTLEQPPGLAVALHFALVGTISLTTDRKRAALIVPNVTDLQQFAKLRPILNPQTEIDCRVANPADAALQAQIRLQNDATKQMLELDHCLALLFTNQSWNEKQKTRAAVLDIDPNTCNLDIFSDAMQLLTPRIVRPTKSKKKGEDPQPFWVDSVVRPLVAENIANGRKWFADFRRLVVSSDGRVSEQNVRQLDFERGGLRTMIDHDGNWEDRGERNLVTVIHEAMRGSFRQIYEENKSNPVTAKNRMNRQRQRWRIAFATAKTADDIRFALNDLWSRTYPNPTLRESWKGLLPILCDENRWKLNRDLALLALASYSSGRPEEEPSIDETTEPSA